MNNLINKNFHGNDWGYFVDIEKYKYDINARPMPLIKTPIYNNGYNNGYNNEDNDNKVVTNIIIKVSSTTIVTAVFACFVYCVL